MVSRPGRGSKSLRLRPPSSVSGSPRAAVFAPRERTSLVFVQNRYFENPQVVPENTVPPPETVGMITTVAVKVSPEREDSETRTVSLLRPFALCPSPPLCLAEGNKEMVTLKKVFLKITYLYFRERGREGERGEKHQCVVASHAPYWGPDLQPRPVP